MYRDLAVDGVRPCDMGKWGVTMLSTLNTLESGGLIEPTAHLNDLNLVDSVFEDRLDGGALFGNVACKRVRSVGLGRGFHETVCGLVGRTGLVVGHVSGPAMPAALAKMGLLGIIRGLSLAGGSLQPIIQQLNGPLVEVNAGIHDLPLRCSLFFVVVDKRAGVLRSYGAEPCRGFVVDRDGEVVELMRGGRPLGEDLGEGIGEQVVAMTNLERLILVSQCTSERSASKGGEPLPKLVGESAELPLGVQVDFLTSRLSAEDDPSVSGAVMAVTLQEARRRATDKAIDSLFSGEIKPGDIRLDPCIYLG